MMMMMMNRQGKHPCPKQDLEPTVSATKPSRPTPQIMWPQGPAYSLLSRQY